MFSCSHLSQTPCVKRRFKRRRFRKGWGCKPTALLQIPVTASTGGCHPSAKNREKAAKEAAKLRSGTCSKRACPACNADAGTSAEHVLPTCRVLAVLISILSVWGPPLGASETGLNPKKQHDKTLTAQALPRSPSTARTGRFQVSSTLGTVHRRIAGPETGILAVSMSPVRVHG